MKAGRPIVLLSEPPPGRSPDDTSFRILRNMRTPLQTVRDEVVNSVADVFLERVQDHDAVYITCNLVDAPRPKPGDDILIRMEIYRHGWRSLIASLHGLERG